MAGEQEESSVLRSEEMKQEQAMYLFTVQKEHLEEVDKSAVKTSMIHNMLGKIQKDPSLPLSQTTVIIAETLREVRRLHPSRNHKDSLHYYKLVKSLSYGWFFS